MRSPLAFGLSRPDLTLLTLDHCRASDASRRGHHDWSPASSMRVSWTRYRFAPYQRLSEDELARLYCVAAARIEAPLRGPQHNAWSSLLPHWAMAVQTLRSLIVICIAIRIVER
jgi:hypothetical protein